MERDPYLAVGQQVFIIPPEGRGFVLKKDGMLHPNEFRPSGALFAKPEDAGAWRERLEFIWGQSLTLDPGESVSAPQGIIFPGQSARFLNTETGGEAGVLVYPPDAEDLTGERNG